MAELTDEEKRILELMKQLEASDPVVPHAAHNQDFLPGIDDQGNPIPLSGPLPSAEDQAAEARRLIRELEAQLEARRAGAQHPGGGPAGKPDPTKPRR